MNSLSQHQYRTSASSFIQLIALTLCIVPHPSPLLFLGLKAGIPWLLNITSGYAVRNVLDSQEGFKLNGTNSRLVYVDFTLLGKNINTIKKNTEA
jgi:hypothetical protein